MLLSLLLLANIFLSDHQLIKAQIADSPRLTLEVVTTPESCTQGLSDRKEIGSDGMLFIYPKSASYAFWMKNMHFDLDLIWIQNTTVVDITYGAKAPSPGQADLPLYSPSSAVDMVLEVKAGDAKAWQIKIGSKLNFL